MKTKLLALILLGGSSLFARTHVSIGIGIGGFGYGYAPPVEYGYVAPVAPVVTYAPPPCPGPGYTWFNGAWYPPAPRYYGYPGYVVRPSFYGGYRVGPRYYGNRYYRGRWYR